jgi:citrate lyase subunit beta/citryl-CoA lyase
LVGLQAWSQQQTKERPNEQLANSRSTVLTRSILYIPGVRPDLMAKANRMPADVIQMDLEDSVPITEKANAREHVGRFVADWDGGNGHLLALKINPLSAKEEYSVPCGLEDLRAIYSPVIDFVLLPKVDTADEARELDAALAELEVEHGVTPGSTRLIPMIESARGLLNVVDIAESCDRVYTLVYTGETDFNAQLLASPQPNPPDSDFVELSFGRQHIALACFAAGLAPPIDNVVLDLDNLEFLRSSSTVARRLGFGGKFCIHPKQVEVVNEVFSPSEDEVQWAHAVLEALEAAELEHRGAVVLEGRMVDIAMGVSARRVVSRAELVKRRTEGLAARQRA